jgi:hypothetical protein
MLAVGDAMTIATQTDAVLLVVDVNEVRRATLTEMRRVLEACPAVTSGWSRPAGTAPITVGIAETATAARGSLMYDEPATAVRGDDVERSARLTWLRPAGLAAGSARRRWACW